MDIGALCRTYNFLAAEGRNVGAALLIEPVRPQTEPWDWLLQGAPGVVHQKFAQENCSKRPSFPT